jgi:hypothetical protein
MRNHHHLFNLIAATLILTITLLGGCASASLQASAQIGCGSFTLSDGVIGSPGWNWRANCRFRKFICGAFTTDGRYVNRDIGCAAALK